MAYCDVGEMRLYLGVSETNDDSLLDSLISASQKMIDNYAGRTFEASEDSIRYFDAGLDVDGALLWLDHDLCAITTITNGDGTDIELTDYITEPRNSLPYYAIRLKRTSGKIWTHASSGDSENVIAVEGRWAYGTTVPDDVKHACVRLAAYLYRQKDNAGDLDRAVIAGNSTILPAQIPSDIKAILEPYRRLVR